MHAAGPDGSFMPRQRCRLPLHHARDRVSRPGISTCAPAARRPQANGKPERFIRTMLGAWADGAIYRNSTERTAALAGWIDFYG